MELQRSAHIWPPPNDVPQRPYEAHTAPPVPEWRRLPRPACGSPTPPSFPERKVAKRPLTTHSQPWEA